MKITQNINSRIILFTIVASVLIIGRLSMAIPPAMVSDTSWGFLVMHSMEHGDAFNEFTIPDVNDISKDHHEFLSWWSPGQYLIPYLFKAIFRLNDGHATALTITLCQLSGLMGLYCFFTKASFSQKMSAVSIGLILCQQLFVAPYTEYSGGEITLFGFIGWFLYGCLAIDRTGLKLILFILLSCFIGFICKSSFMWMYLAGLCYLWIRISTGSKNIIPWLQNGVWIATPAITAIAAIYICYLSGGKNPSSDAKGWLSLASAFKLSWIITLLPASAPVLTNLSIDEHLNGLSSHNRVIAFFILITSAALSVYLIVGMVRKIPYNNYKIIVLVFYIFCILFFGISYFHGASISFEGRHFRVMGLITLPAIVFFLKDAKPVFQILAIAACVFLLILNISILYRGFKNNNVYPHGITGIAQPLLDTAVITYLSVLDNQSKHNIIVVPVHYFNCTRGLEVQNSRLINWNGEVFKGHAGSLFVLVPKDQTINQINAMLSSFPGYHNFSEKKISDHFKIYESP